VSTVLTADEAGIAIAARRLADGHLVAFPTETVYGLGARADNDAAVAGIFAAKGRPADHPLIVHLARAAAAGAFAADISPDAQRLMAAFWPGPLTVIVPRRAGYASAAAGGQNSIGLRVPAHPVALALLQAAAALGVPGVAAPSANRFGRISPTTAAHVVQERLGGQPMVLDGGACAVGIESAIVDCTRSPPALLRPGALSQQQLAQMLGMPLMGADAQSPRASGTLQSHYAPQVPLRLWDAPALVQAVQAAQDLHAQRPRPQQVVAVYSRLDWGLDLPSPRAWVFRRMPDDAAAAAHELFAVLRELDDAAVSAIWVERPPASPVWDGVRDRLERAAFSAI
jgi:L-threonylcarbamoyladenylate synthase